MKKRVYPVAPDVDTVAGQSHLLGCRESEPLILGFDLAIRYARAYRTRFGSSLADDGVLGPSWLSWVKGLHGLLDGDGAVAMERGITADSKDNGYCESLFWFAVQEAGFSEEELA